jgi:predicted nucleic acid-binding protein
MKKLKIYLDTSVINFLKVEDSPDYRRDTELFFNTIVTSEKVETYVSRIVFEEINNTDDLIKRKELLDVFEQYPNIKTLVADENNVEEINFLVDSYLDNGIIPRKNIADAFHVAYSTIFEMDILLSWNFRHLANINKEQKIVTVNKLNGYNYPFRMANPLEVINYE